MHTVKLALDWQPDFLHAPFLLGIAGGAYRNAGIELELIPPSRELAASPAKQVANGCAHLGVVSSETVLSYRTLRQPVQLLAIATLVQQDISAIAVDAGSGLHRPSELIGRKYVSSSTRYEDFIVRELIRNDGGKGFLQIHRPARMDAWNEFLAGAGDFAWVYTPRHEPLALLNAKELRMFRMADFGVPYGYAPVLVANQPMLQQYGAVIRQFLTITRDLAVQIFRDPDACGKVIQQEFPGLQFQRLGKHITDAICDTSGNWGTMDEQVWQNFIRWMNSRNLCCCPDGIPHMMDSEMIRSFFTNEFLSAE